MKNLLLVLILCSTSLLASDGIDKIDSKFVCNTNYEIDITTCHRPTDNELMMMRDHDSGDEVADHAPDSV